MKNFEITFVKIPKYERTNCFLFRTDNVFIAAKWAKTMCMEFKIQEVKDDSRIMYGEVIDLEIKLPKKKYFYYYVEASGSVELTDRFLVRVEENSYGRVKQLVEKLDIRDFEIRRATIEDIVSSLPFDCEITNLCSTADLMRGE